VNVAALLAALVIGSPFTAAADSTDRAAWSLIGQILAAVITQPFAALYSTLLYFDLRQRKRGV
jgi:hypothetical protein